MGLGTSLVLLLAPLTPVLAQDPPPTPNEDDIPSPVPLEMSLAGDPLPDITRFLNVRTANAPELSPDGTRLAFSTSITGVPQVWVVDAGGGWPKQLTFGEPITFHAWSPAGDWILYGSDRGGNEREGYYLVSPDGTRERELLPPSDAFRVFGSFTRDGRRIVYATTERTGVDFDIHMLDVASGEAREIFRGRMGLYPASFSPDGARIVLTEARGEDANDLYLVDAGTGALDTLFAAATPRARNAYAVAGWTPDGRGFYLVTDHEREHAGLAFYDLAARSLAWVETPDAVDVEGAELSPDGRHLWWTTNESGWSVPHLRDLEEGVGIPVPASLPRGLAGAQFAAGAPVLAVRVSAPGLPGDVWTWNVETGEVHRATESSTAGLDLSAMIVPEHHSFAARDGLELHGLLYLPANVPEGELPPVLLSVHGGPTAQARPGFNPVHQYLLTRGIAVFDLNFRGSTGYGKTFARANDGRRRAVEYLDMADAVAWLGEQGLVDAERAAVMGGSYGGYLTMAAVTRLPDVFRSGVAFVGVSDWVTALEGASPQLKASDRIEYGDIDDPDDRAFFETVSPITYVDGDEAPVMVLHGANDPRDPVTESDQFVRAIREAGGEVEYLRFPDEGHGIRKLQNRIIAYRRVAEFLERTLEIVRRPVM
jgi:dipeptidyl aminopeptidase/acylaminoacyl peptidase